MTVLLLLVVGGETTSTISDGLLEREYPPKSPNYKNSSRKILTHIKRQSASLRKLSSEPNKRETLKIFHNFSGLVLWGICLLCFSLLLLRNLAMCSQPCGLWDFSGMRKEFPQAKG